jgi:sugar phosphate isomerase/epimerase
MRELGVSIIYGRKENAEKSEHLRMIADAGFDCFFTSYDESASIDALANQARRLGVRFETIHTPFENMNWMWVNGEKGDQALAELKSCIDICARVDVDKCIVHVTISSTAPAISAIGMNRFLELDEYALQKGVHIAYENLEIPEHLDAVLLDAPLYHGFCWDCGHNYCYTPLVDMMGKYADRLICTHIHDNFGVRTPGLITYYDDLHMLPMEGGLNWQGFADRIKASGYMGPLTLELSAKAKQEYQTMPLQEFYQRAYAAANLLRVMCDGNC